MSPSFQAQDFEHMTFPAQMLIDYVRVYQREGLGASGYSCDPSSRPTADYIDVIPDADEQLAYQDWYEDHESLLVHV